MQVNAFSTQLKLIENPSGSDIKPLICGNFRNTFLLHFNYFFLSFSRLAPSSVVAFHDTFCSVFMHTFLYSLLTFLLIYFFNGFIIRSKVSIITSLMMIRWNEYWRLLFNDFFWMTRDE